MKHTNIMTAFAEALTGKAEVEYRIHAQLTNGNIGITAWYASQESIDALKEEIEASGATILKVETK